jgi:hypothetical protein
VIGFDTKSALLHFLRGGILGWNTWELLVGEWRLGFGDSGVDVVGENWSDEVT